MGAWQGRVGVGWGSQGGRGGCVHEWVRGWVWAGRRGGGVDGGKGRYADGCVHREGWVGWGSRGGRGNLCMAGCVAGTGAGWGGVGE